MTCPRCQDTREVYNPDYGQNFVCLECTGPRTPAIKRLTDERLAAIRTRLSAATPGPWGWHGNVDSRNLRLSTYNRKPGRAESTVMDFVRHGMRGAVARFQNQGSYMDRACDDPLPIYDVCRDCTDRKDERVYRGDIVGLRHPDAELIAQAPQDMLDMLAHIAYLEDELQGELDRRGAW